MARSHGSHARMSCYLSPTRFWLLLCRPFSKTLSTSLGAIYATAPHECPRTEVPRCTHASLRAATRVNMPAAHRDPSLQSSVGLVYLAEGRKSHAFCRQFPRRTGCRSLCDRTSVHMCVYIYIYMCMHLDICIYIDIYI